MQAHSRKASEVIGEIAGLQHGVVTRAQLLASGLQSGAIGRRIRDGLLIAVHPGVYRVGHASPSVVASYFSG